MKGINVRGILNLKNGKAIASTLHYQNKFLLIDLRSSSSITYKEIEIGIPIAENVLGLSLLPKDRYLPNVDPEIFVKTNLSIYCINLDMKTHERIISSRVVINNAMQYDIKNFGKSLIEVIKMEDGVIKIFDLSSQ